MPKGATVDKAGGEDDATDALRQILADLGLNGYETNVLVALVRAGSLTATELPRLAAIPRTSVYPVLEALNSKGLAVRISQDRPARWGAPSREEILERLEAAHHQRTKDAKERHEALLRELQASEQAELAEMRARSERARELLEGFRAPPVAADMHFARLMHTPRQHARLYDQLLARARQELLVFNTPPYLTPIKVNPAVLGALERGIDARALYERGDLGADAAEGFCETIAEYSAAGVEGRVVERLPFKLVVVDREVAALMLPDLRAPRQDFSPGLLIEHPDFAAFAAAAFDQFWENAEPYVGGAAAVRDAGGTRPHARGDGTAKDRDDLDEVISDGPVTAAT